MTLLIKKVVGESFDLETGEVVNKGILVTNGRYERVIPMGEEGVFAILEMYADPQEGEGLAQVTPDDDDPAYLGVQGPEYGVGPRDPGEEYIDDTGTESI